MFDNGTFPLTKPAQSVAETPVRVWHLPRWQGERLPEAIVSVTMAVICTACMAVTSVAVLAAFGISLG